MIFAVSSEKVCIDKRYCVRCVFSSYYYTPLQQLPGVRDSLQINRISLSRGWSWNAELSSSLVLCVCVRVWMFYVWTFSNQGVCFLYVSCRHLLVQQKKKKKEDLWFYFLPSFTWEIWGQITQPMDFVCSGALVIPQQISMETDCGPLS